MRFVYKSAHQRSERGTNVAGKTLTKAQLQAAADAYNAALKAGYMPMHNPGPVTVAAHSLGIEVGAYKHRLRRAREMGYEIREPEKPEQAAPIEPAEVHDAKFYKRKVARQNKEIERLEHLIRELGGLDVVPDKPKWPTKATGGKGKSVVAGLISDLHDGEKIEQDEIHGINAYDPDIATERMQRYMVAFCEVGQRWASDTVCEGALLTFNGDLTSGDIHEELMMTNTLTALEQVHHCAGIVSACIQAALNTYKTLHVVGTPGNHGRTTKKSTAKLYGRLSYDTLIMKYVHKEWEGDKRVTFQYGHKDAVTHVLGQTILTTHGDKIGTGGGQGFAGPTLPVLRGSKKLIEQMGSINQTPTIIQIGHFHKVGNPYIGSVPIFQNGSVVGYSEYAGDIRASVEPPFQWMYLIHSKWGPRDRMPVMLGD